eukprot:TRINITY_DN1260_c0_g1_i1.p1 TRINITY_DN1260_c0_g1~~TRINITY_DN1260_c0_g1_i1.p1  ORF type:complete len:1536 (+),score=290.62 TRINITY_DN1260_c0_g1_i1:141-4748(+)
MALPTPSGRRLRILAVALSLPEVAFSHDEVGSQCAGFEEEFAECPKLVPCHNCTPQDCLFKAWSDWCSEDGCTGLRHRLREIDTVNNECGKPCAGAKIETQRDVNEEKDCTLPSRSCVLSHWTAWSPCSAGQRYRRRSVEQLPSNGGQACEGPLSETMSCAAVCEPEDCSFSDWHDWAPCSKSCGHGTSQRLRRLVSQPSCGGDPCAGAIVEMRDCEEKACATHNADVAAWSDWSPCDGRTRSQRYRERKMHGEATGKGAEFTGPLMETEDCVKRQPQDCVFSEWQDWSACDRACDGGQKFRKRSLRSQASDGGVCAASNPVEEISSCNEHLCVVPVNCELSEWSGWSNCTGRCGQGTISRHRHVLSEAKHGGDGCVGQLQDVKPCPAADMAAEGCGQVDCEWNDWMDWGACSCDCGGGTKRRSRTTSQSPRNGGKLCSPLDKAEVQPCNTKPCEKNCIDGRWSDWAGWSGCSATCGLGYRSRDRHVAHFPNGCGKALEGAKVEFDECTGLKACVPDVDCELADWSDWTSCSCQCFGVRERTRYIKTFMAGNGTACVSESLQETSSCNPGPGEDIDEECEGRPPVDCHLSEWSEYSECSKSCGGGQKQKKRRVSTPAANGGEPCNGTLSITEPCNDKPCDKEVCTDCKWTEWGSWSKCTHCGGQQFRHRQIDELPTHCGKPCDTKATTEVSNCTSMCEEEFSCAWSDWNSHSECKADNCGPSAELRHRVLGWGKKTVEQESEKDSDTVLFFGLHGGRCSGAQAAYDSCPRSADCDACKPQDCILGDWEDWGAPSCEGLCERQRSVATVNNECGNPCEGILTETKRCPAACDDPVPCKWGKWSDWSECLSPYGQRTKSRKVKELPKLGGMSCEGEASITEPCQQPEMAKDCVLSDWSQFGECSADCGGGLQSRTRVVTEPSQHGGMPCTGSLEELLVCNTQECKREDKDCTMSDWGAWTTCNSNDQRERLRWVVSPAKGLGKRCHGDLRMVETCGTQAKDCVLFDWTEWDQCDKECDGGQKRRQRMVRSFPKNGGKRCPSNMMEVAGCNTKVCVDKDCELAEWVEWSKCSSECGSGQQSRERDIKQLRAGKGAGCGEALQETRACHGGGKACEAPVDCQWGDWNDWNECDSRCGGGQRVRNRHIRQAPLHGGKQCEPKLKEEVSPCNMKSCGGEECIDGEWADWTMWAECSITCGGGITSRTRRVAVTANSCGRPATGKDRETEFCNVEVPCHKNRDCEFAEWSVWSSCTATCDGLKHRSREIETYGAGDGKWCLGALKETSPCNPDSGKKSPEACRPAEPVDCELGKWEDWSACTATCDGGHQERSRQVHQMPHNGGKACDGPTRVIRECGRKACEGPTPINCQLGDWQAWGACSKCGGQKKRFRNIIQYAAHGGTPCGTAEIEEVTDCPVTCIDQHFCLWTDWGAWSACSSKCGSGQRSRRRDMKASDSVDKPQLLSIKEMIAKFEVLHGQTEQMAQSRLQDMAVAFFGGGLSLLAGLSVWRVANAFGRGQADRRAFGNDRSAAEMEMPLRPSL